MRSAVCYCCFVISLFMTLVPNISCADETEPAKFVIVAPKSGMTSELDASLYRVLRFGSQKAKFERVESIEEAAASKADIIVLAMPQRELPPIEKETLDIQKNSDGYWVIDITNFDSKADVKCKLTITMEEQ